MPYKAHHAASDMQLSAVTCSSALADFTSTGKPSDLALRCFYCVLACCTTLPILLVGLPGCFTIGTPILRLKVSQGLCFCCSSSFVLKLFILNVAFQA